MNMTLSKAVPRGRLNNLRFDYCKYDKL